jgi:hypothetical protein
MITKQLLIVTAHPEFASVSVTELKQLDKRLTRIEELAPGVTLCDTVDVTALMQLAAHICTPSCPGTDDSQSLQHNSRSSSVGYSNSSATRARFARTGNLFCCSDTSCTNRGESRNTPI